MLAGCLWIVRIGGRLLWNRRSVECDAVGVTFVQHRFLEPRRSTSHSLAECELVCCPLVASESGAFKLSTYRRCVLVLLAPDDLVVLFDRCNAAEVAGVAERLAPELSLPFRESSTELHVWVGR
jgi:hypothetical protein